MIGFAQLIVTATGAGPPDASNGSVLLAVLIAILTGGAGATFYSFYRYRKQGQQERDQLIGDASKAAVEAAKAMLEEYRQELESAKRGILRLERELAESNERIKRLEEDLASALEDRDRLAAALGAAVRKRAEQEREMITLQRRIAELAAIVEGGAESGPSGSSPSDPP